MTLVERLEALDARRKADRKKIVDLEIDATLKQRRIEQLEAALTSGRLFLAKLDAALPHIEGIVLTQTARGYPYEGPQIGVEMEAFRQALAALESKS